MNETLNKTGTNDADGLAQLADAGFYKAVRVKGLDAMLTRTLIGVRKQAAGMSIQLSNQIRGFMKTFGLIVPKSKGRAYSKGMSGGTVSRLATAGNQALERMVGARPNFIVEHCSSIATACNERIYRDRSRKRPIKLSTPTIKRPSLWAASPAVEPAASNARS